MHCLVTKFDTFNAFRIPDCYEFADDAAIRVLTSLTYWDVARVLLSD